MRICFTGKAKDKSGSEIDRSTLEKSAEDAGLIPVSSVTKKECDVVVAEDKSSSSGKAKKARDYGIPVISVKEFLDAIQKN
jgi:DNA polymerase-3 subunit epsilon